MYRREALRAGAGALALAAVGRSGAARTGYEPLGRIPLPAAQGVSVSDDRSTVYVASDDGFVVVDVSDPADPRVVAERRELLADREDGPMSSVDVSVSGDRLLVGGPAFASPDRIWGYLLYDVSDPASPRRLFVRETDHALHNVRLDGTTAYLTGTGLPNGPMVVVDVSGDEPTELSRWSIDQADADWSEVGKLMRTCHDVVVRGDTAYALFWEAGTWILDVSDPSTPTPLGTVGGVSAEAAREAERDDPEVALMELPGNVHSAAPTPDGSVLAVAHEAFDRYATPEQRGPGGVVLWNVADPAEPSELARIDPPPTPDPTGHELLVTAHNIDVAGDRLYSGWNQGGVKVHDVSDPADPTELAWWRRPDVANFWTAQVVRPGEFFVASSTSINGTESALYTFPDEAGRQVDPPSLTTTTSSTTDTTPGSTTTSTTSRSTSPSTRSSSTTSTSGDAGTASTTSVDAPGFDAGAAVVGLGIGAWLARRRSD